MLWTRFPCSATQWLLPYSHTPPPSGADADGGGVVLGRRGGVSGEARAPRRPGGGGARARPLGFTPRGPPPPCGAGPHVGCRLPGQGRTVVNQTPPHLNPTPHI